MDGFLMENPIKMDDLGVPLFSETSIYSIYTYLDTEEVLFPPPHICFKWKTPPLRPCHPLLPAPWVLWRIGELALRWGGLGWLTSHEIDGRNPKNYGGLGGNMICFLQLGDFVVCMFIFRAAMYRVTDLLYLHWWCHGGTAEGFQELPFGMAFLEVKDITGVIKWDPSSGDQTSSKSMVTMTTVNTPSDRARVCMDLCMFCLVSFCFSKSLRIGIWIMYAILIYIYILFLLAEVWWNLEDGSSNACRLSISSVATCDFFPWTLGLPSHLVASSLGGWHVTGVWKHPRSRFAGVSATWAAVQ